MDTAADVLLSRGQEEANGEMNCLSGVLLGVDGWRAGKNPGSNPPQKHTNSTGLGLVLAEQPGSPILSQALVRPGI